MKVIEGTVIGTGGRGRDMWMNIRTVEGHEYRGAIPRSLLTTVQPGTVIRIRVSWVHGTEFGNPRNAEVFA